MESKHTMFVDLNTKFYSEIPDEQMKRAKKAKNAYNQTGRLLKKSRSFSKTITIIKSFFGCAVALCKTKNALLVISNFT
jgi:hypothetical protein